MGKDNNENIVHLDLADREVTKDHQPVIILNVQHGYSSDQEAKKAFFDALLPGGIFKTQICVLKIKKTFLTEERSSLNFYGSACFSHHCLVFNRLDENKEIQGRIYLG